MTYLEEIEQIIKTHSEINQAIVHDVIHRCRDWLEHEDSNETDSYIKRQKDYLQRWIK